MPMVPDVTVVFLLNGERKELHYRKLPFSAWSELKAQLRFTPMSLCDALMEYDLEAFGAVIWLERKQRERALRWPTIRAELEREDCDIEFVDALVDGQSQLGTDETADEEEPDPTAAGS